VPAGSASFWIQSPDLTWHSENKIRRIARSHEHGGAEDVLERSGIHFPNLFAGAFVQCINGVALFRSIDDDLILVENGTRGRSPVFGIRGRTEVYLPKLMALKIECENTCLTEV